MNNHIAISLAVTAMLGVLALPSQPVLGQSAPPPPPKPSFSNGTKARAPKPVEQARRQATQEELADAVLGDTMNQLWVQIDHHFHEGEYNHAINLCRIVVQGDPHNMEAYANASWLLWSTGRNEEALKILVDGAAANPEKY